MNLTLNPNIQVTANADELFPEDLINEERHELTVRIDGSKNYSSLEFSSRLSMYQFALSLLQEAVFGSGGQKEFYPLVENGHAQVVDGVRMNHASARLFISYGD